MFEWFISNMGTIIVSLILAVAVFLVLLKLIRDKKSGKNYCGNSCAGCSDHGCQYRRRNRPL